MSNQTEISCDVVIVGAGPCGLFQVFELGLLGIKAHVVDSLKTTGGQCSALYPEKPIYDIPALPVCGAQELIDRLEEQIAPFSPTYHLDQQVSSLERLPNGRFRLQTRRETVFDTATVIIAGGLGAFEPRPLRLEGIDQYVGVNLHYRVTDKSQFAGKKLLVCGGGDSALDWTLDLYEQAESMHLVHRRDDFRAQPASVEKMKQLCAQAPDKIGYTIGRIKEYFTTDDRLSGVRVLSRDKSEHHIEFDDILVFFGLSPDLGPIAQWGLDIDKRQINVDTEKFQTSVPGIFAVGDINTYPGKKKLILSGFHEAALAAYAVQKHLDPDAKQHVQYTTTSTLMHERLGVAEKN